MTENEILRYAVKNGMLDVHTIGKIMIMEKRKEYLEKHTYKIWKNEKNSRWYTYIPDGDGRKLVKRKEKEDIEDVIVDYYKNVDDEEAKKNAYTFEKAFQSLLDKRKIFGVSENTVYHYQKDYDRFFKGEKISSIEVSEITDDIIGELLKSKTMALKIPYTSLKAMYGYINRTMEQAVRDKIITDNPCRYVDIQLLKKYCVEKEHTTETRTLSDNEIDTLLDKLHKSYKEKPWYIPQYAVEFAIYTGLRVGELAALKWSDINYNARTVTIQRSEKEDRISKQYYISDTKNHKVRYIPLTNDMVKLLKTVESVEKMYGFYCEWIFADLKGRVHKSIISECIRNRTIKFNHTRSIHAIRRTFNSKLRCAGASSTVASSILGHTERVNECNYTYDITDNDTKRNLVESLWKKGNQEGNQEGNQG